MLLSILLFRFCFFRQCIIIVVFLQHLSHCLQFQFSFVHIVFRIKTTVICPQKPIQINFKYLFRLIIKQCIYFFQTIQVNSLRQYFHHICSISTKYVFIDFQIQISLDPIIYKHPCQMRRQNYGHHIKTLVKKQKAKCPSANKTDESTKHIAKTEKPSRHLSKDYGCNEKVQHNLYPRNVSKGISFKNLKNKKANNIYCSNPQIGIRKTMPCIYRNSSSIQYPKQLSLNSRQKLKIIVPKPSKVPKQREAKVNKAKAKVGLTIMKNLKIKQYLSPHNQFKKQYPSIKPQRLQRKTTQQYATRSKTCSKNKNKAMTKPDKHQTQIKSQLSNGQGKPIYQSKSSCITRNISKKNSKEKQHFHEAVGEKFKKKRGKQQKKLKKQAVYTSMKISRRNSVKFLQTKKDGFVVLGQEKRKRDFEGQMFASKRDVHFKYDLAKTKSLRNLDLLKADGLEIDEQFIEQSTIGERAFSYKKQKHLINEDTNPHEISIDNFLQCREGSFRLQSEQSLKQRLTKISLSLQQLRQQQFPNLEQLQSLNEFQAALEASQHLGNDVELLPRKNPAPIFYPQQRHPLVQRAQVIDWLSILVSTMLLKTESFHLAVGYFDAYCYGVNDLVEGLSNDQVRLTAVACLTLAIKIDERQLEHDIFNAYSTLQVGFSKQQIVNTQQAIVKRLHLSLNLPTLCFYLDYYTSHWDTFLSTLCIPPQSHPNIYFRSLHGRSYQNYRRSLEICNSIIMDAPQYSHDYQQLVLSVIHVICWQNIERIQQERVFERIDNFSRSLKRSVQRDSQDNQDGKENIPTFSTQETLDGLGMSAVEVVKGERLSIDNKQRSSQMPKTNKESKLINVMPNKQKDYRNSYKAMSEFMSTYEAFIKKQMNRDISQLDTTITYVKQFSQLKFILQVDPRVYQQAQTYEDFMRYHSYSPHAKLYVLKRIQERTKSLTNL